MSRKTIDNVRIKQWGLTLQEWEKANARPGDHSLLKLNELGIIRNESGAMALVIGNDSDTVSEMYQNNIEGNSSTNIFFSGIGAGYELPLASSTIRGGLKFNPYYFSLSNEQLNPVLLRRATPDPITGKYYNEIGEVTHNEPLTLPNNHDLRIQGSLFVHKIITEERLDMQVESNYIDVHKKIAKEVIEQVECLNGTELFLENITILEKYHESILIEDSSKHLVRDYQVFLVEGHTIIKSESFETGETYTVRYTSISDEVWVLGEGETAGIRIYNYSADDQYLPEEERKIAELSIKNDGSLWYTKDALGIDGQIARKRIGILENSQPGVVMLENSGNLYSASSLDMEYLPNLGTLTINKNILYNPKTGNVSIDIRQDYCDTIVANGQEYKVKDNKIDLGSPVWTEDLYNKLQSAVQTIKFNGIEYVGPNPEFSYTYSANINSGTLIDVKKDGEKFTIDHIQPEDYNKNAGLSSSQILIGTNNNTSVNTISTIVRDSQERGHVIDYTMNNLDFSPLISDITTLKTQLANANSKISSLETQLEDVLRRLEYLEAQI